MASRNNLDRELKLSFGAKAEIATSAAKQIINAEEKARLKKTERLKALRLQRASEKPPIVPTKGKVEKKS